MITEDYVSFEVAKLLKEKGFDEEIETIISPDCEIYHCDERSVFKIPHKTIRNSDINIYSDDCSCPTIQMAMKWLREEKNIDCTPYLLLNKRKYSYIVTQIKPINVLKLCHENYNYYEEACEAAIKYCLTNLI